MYQHRPEYSSETILEKESAIRRIFLSKDISPHFFCSYLTFSRIFKKPNIYQAYTAQNLNIIDTHLRFHQSIAEEMAPYKWVPSLTLMVLTKFNTFSLVFPILYTNAFDHYFRKFFIWKHRNEKIINIRNEFITKLSKAKNKLRRVLLYERLEPYLNPNQSVPSADSNDIPPKYIKFGKYTQYIFHAAVLEEHTEQSHVHLTSLFETYMQVKSGLVSSLKRAYSNTVSLWFQYKQFKKDYREHRKDYDQYLFLYLFSDSSNLQDLLKYRDIRPDTIYTETKRIEMRIRRLLEIWNYNQTNQLLASGFTIADWTHLNQRSDTLEEQKFNIQGNMADLAILYSIVGVPKLLRYILKRKVSM